MDDIAIFGRKSFFITPDDSLIPEVYMEAFFSRGYECYIVKSDSVCSVQKKVSDIISLYAGSILVFNLDSELQGSSWKSLISNIQNQNGTIICAIHKTKGEARDAQIASEYKACGVRGGVLPLVSNGEKNLINISNLLFENGACGRRTMVRALCDAQSNISFTANNRTYRAKILDVNLQYFACDFADNTIDFEIYERIKGASILINGMSFDSDVVLIMKGKRRGLNLGVFMFTKGDGTPDLETALHHQLSKKLYQMVASQGKEVLHRAWTNA